jgi:hypothetical protein
VHRATDPGRGCAARALTATGKGRCRTLAALPLAWIALTRHRLST